MVYENGELVAESERFHYESQLIVADLDLERLTQERMRQNILGQVMQHHREELRRFRKVSFELEAPRAARLLCKREIDRFPYVPAAPAVRVRRRYVGYNSQGE